MRSVRPVLGEHSGPRGSRGPTGFGSYRVPVSAQKPELILEMVVKSAKFVVAATTDFIVIKHEIFPWFGNDRAEAHLEGLMADETFGDDVLDGFPLSCRTAEHASRHATNLVTMGCYLLHNRF